MPAAPSTPLSRTAILEAAIDLADRDGLDSLSMRALARSLGTAPMSLYRHVRDKDDLLDGMVEAVHERFPLPDPGVAPRPALSSAYAGAFEVLLAHPWAAGLALERPALGPARLRHADRCVAALRSGGRDLQQAHTLMHALETHLFGFALQVHSTWSAGATFGPEAAAVSAGDRAQEYPDLTAMLAAIQHDHRREFTEILDTLLAALPG